MLPWSIRIAIAANIATGVEFLHAQTPVIVHRDLKCGRFIA